VRTVPLVLALSFALSGAALAQSGAPGSGSGGLRLSLIGVDGVVDCARREAPLTDQERAAVHGFEVAGYARDASARTMLARAACHGDGLAARRLGFIVQHGIGIPQNEVEAVRWYRVAAEAGDSRGMSNLGAMLNGGRGVERDQQAAVALFQRSAEAGDEFGMFNLGLAYFHGTGVPRDLAEAARWFAASAALGNPNAMVTLATMTGNGQGVPRDDRVAAELYLRAFHRGPPAIRAHFENGMRFATEAVRMEVQRHLSARGLYAGPIDGAISPQTLDAMRRWTP